MAAFVYGNYHRNVEIGALCLLGAAHDLASAHDDAARSARYGDAEVHELEVVGAYRGRIVRVVRVYKHRPRGWFWTGPREGDVDAAGETLRDLPDERWPYGAPEEHDPGCRLFDGGVGVFCDCLASASDEGA